MKPFAIIKVLFITYLFSACLLLMLAFGLYKFGLGSDKLRLGIMAIYGVSGFLAGFISGKISETRKYLWGMISGICYFLILLIVSVIMNKGFDMDFGNCLLQFGLCTGCGILGGMLA